MSPDFADHFEKVLINDLLPGLVPMVRGYLLQIENQPEAERREFLKTMAEDRKNRTAIWESWQGVWKDLTEKKPLPKKPEPVSGSGILKRLTDKVTNKPAKRGEMTIQQWQEKTGTIKKSNAIAAENWGKITQESDLYQTPEDQDRKFLMDLFARSPGDLESQITALHQIATQGGTSKAFDSYTSGRNVDLAMLAACYRYPGVFLKISAQAKPAQEVNADMDKDVDADNGENKPQDAVEKPRSFLKNALRGIKSDARKSLYPLVSRFVYDNAE